MSIQYDALPKWEFTVVEQSGGVWKVDARRVGGITGGTVGSDVDAMLEDLKSWAQRVEADLGGRT